MKSGVRKAAELLEIPAGVAGDDLRLELIGSRLLIAENHQGIRVYQPDLIVFRGRHEWARVRGEGLCLLSLSRERLEIQGRIDDVQLAEVAKHEN